MPKPDYESQTAILPGLRRIQNAYGYLLRDELIRFSRESAIPLYRIQEVASYFPHFHLTQPPRVAVKVCRDMACHLAGSNRMLDELLSLADAGTNNVHIEGVSCVGRCDRAPAVCIAIVERSQTDNGGFGEPRELYYLGREIDELKRIVSLVLDAGPSAVQSDSDSGRDCYPAEDWMIDPYKRQGGRYDAVRKVVAARDLSLRRAAAAVKHDVNLAGDIPESIEALQDPHRPMDKDAPGSPLPDWVAEVFRQLDDAHASLRGMGGAGIPAEQKWKDVRSAVGEARRRHRDERAYVVVNGDESEPGTFKDRELLLHFPHLVIEGVIVAALITDATEGFIYIRHEYPEQAAACEAEIHRAEAAGVCGVNAPVLGRPLPISVFVSPGGYICGEQSALVETISGRRGEPRNLPPKLETNGINDLPTLVSNVETFAWVPFILLNTGQAYARLGVNERKGRRFFSVCGDVTRPGVYEVPMGLTLRDLITGQEYCQGIAGNRELKALAASGPSGGILPAKLVVGTGLPVNHTRNPEWLALAARRGFDPLAQELDIMDLELELNLFRALSPTQMLGAGIVVYAEGRDMVEHAVNALEFFRNESCGKCVPCRIGSQKLANLGANLLAGRIDDVTWPSELVPIVKELGDVMGLTSICGLGRSVPMPLRTLIEYFHDDVARHLKKSGT
jgi:NADH:ubiquinone oxidoreductase subunit F (NADH-binding)/NADH:ubiquinone oxidoreductase subunit E